MEITAGSGGVDSVACERALRNRAHTAPSRCMASRKRGLDPSSKCPAPLRSPAPPLHDGLDTVTSTHDAGNAALREVADSRSPPPDAEDAARHGESLHA